jgi:hypothetical protein
MRGTYDSRAIVGRPSFEPIIAHGAENFMVSATTKQNSTKNLPNTPQSSSKRVRYGVVGLGPASATLIEKHEREKQAVRIAATARGRQAAALDAAGATLGAIGLAGFALAVWKMLPDYGTGFVLLSATLTWLALAIMTWFIHIWRTTKSDTANGK